MNKHTNAFAMTDKISAEIINTPTGYTYCLVSFFTSENYHVSTPKNHQFFYTTPKNHQFFYTYRSLGFFTYYHFFNTKEEASHAGLKMIKEFGDSSKGACFSYCVTKTQYKIVIPRAVSLFSFQYGQPHDLIEWFRSIHDNWQIECAEKFMNTIKGGVKIPISPGWGEVFAYQFDELDDFSETFKTLSKKYNTQRWARWQPLLHFLIDPDLNDIVLKQNAQETILREMVAAPPAKQRVKI